MGAALGWESSKPCRFRFDARTIAHDSSGVKSPTKKKRNPKAPLSKVVDFKGFAKEKIMRRDDCRP